MDPRRGGRGGCRRGRLRPRSATALGAAELSDPRAHAISAGGAAAGDPAVLHRAELRRAPLRPRRSIVDLRTGQRHCRRVGVRDRARHRSGRLRVSGAFGATGRAARRAVPGAGRRARLQAAVRHGVDERLRDEFRGAVRQRVARAEQRRPQGWVRPRYRRGRPDPLPSWRRRRDLGTRLGLLRCPYQGRRLRSRYVRGQGSSSPGEVHLDQVESGRQARHRWRAARGQGHRGDRRLPRSSGRREVRQPGRALGFSHPA